VTEKEARAIAPSLIPAEGTGVSTGVVAHPHNPNPARTTPAYNSGGTPAVNGFSEMVGFIWSVADLLRGDYKQSEYGKVILPLTVLRRLDCILEPTKPAVLTKVTELSTGKIGNVDLFLRRASKQPFYNISPLNFRGGLGTVGRTVNRRRCSSSGTHTLERWAAQCDERALIKLATRLRQTLDPFLRSRCCS
jgi:hypothetical protein